MTLLAALSLGIWVFLLLGHGGFWRDGEMLAPSRPVSAAAVTVIVPARDEALAVQQSVRSLLAQDYLGELRVILVDDQSRDGTGAMARALGDPRLRVIDGSAPPAGWSGKLWALEQGVALADGEFLLLTDADIEHAPSHLSALVAKAEGGAFDLVSEMVGLNCASAAERWLVPAFVFFFAMLYPFALAGDPASGVAAAAGGTMLVRRAALVRAGGFEAMRGALIDDVALASRIKAGGRIWLGHSRLAWSRRAYPAARDIWRMVARTAYVQLRFSPLRLAGTVAGMVLVFAVPMVAVLVGPGGARLAGLLAWVGMAAAYAPTLRRFGNSPWRGVALPFVAMFYTAATVGSAVDHYSGRGVQWKRRTYS